MRCRQRLRIGGVLSLPQCHGTRGRTIIRSVELGVYSSLRSTSSQSGVLAEKKCRRKSLRGEIKPKKVGSDA